MAKRKRSKTDDLDLDFGSGKLPSKEEIESGVSKLSPHNDPSKRIPFTTALTPLNRAKLETASHEGAGSIADILNKALNHYFDQVQTVENEEMMNVFLKIYAAKVK